MPSCRGERRRPHTATSLRPVSPVCLLAYTFAPTRPHSAEWLVAPFKYDKPLPEALAELKSAIAAYPPGQSGIDGGGFKLVSEQPTADGAYLYVQFESRRKGYIDDMEFALSKGVVNVRTSSRLGYLDMGVNAKRFNWFARKMGATPGWSAQPLLAKGRVGYFSQNGIAEADVMGER